jgi:chromate transporter
VRYGGLPWMQGVFYGVGACVIGIMSMSAYTLTLKNVGRDRLLWVVYLVAALATVIYETEYVALFLLAGVVVWLWRVRPRWKPSSMFRGDVLAAAAVLAGEASLDHSLLMQIAVFFAKAGAFVFGSGLAIVPFLYSGVVNEHHWLSERQFLDAVAVAMITPGPVVITVGFIGYLVAGLAGACVAALGTFFPCYLFTVIPAPYFKKYGKRPGIAAFVDGVTAAAIGAITGAVIVLGRRSLVDVPTVLMALATAAVLWRFKKVPEPAVVAVAAIGGIALYRLVPH